ncbi:glycosyltransferase [Bacteroides xylanisolvens]|uniref:glycosyltransferase n=1 Tax=Bacteroides xylanisolvens TaxID=371601 RepID=UPI00374E92A2
MNTTPLVSVVMSVYNGASFLTEAIDSILSQTYKKIEFIIIDDGSTDGSLDIINGYSDERIKIWVNSKNEGLIFSLNKGIELALGTYIVRMDADDISLPQRIEEQVSFMETHNEIGVCGTNIEVFGKSVSGYIHRFKQTPLANDATLLFTTCFAHPSVIIRKSVLDQYHLCYENVYRNAEDYGFWVELSKYTQFANINKVLLKYRILQGSITRMANKDLVSRYEIHKLIYQNYLLRNNISLSDDELWIHFLISDNKRFVKSKYVNTPVIVYQHLMNLLDCYKRIDNFCVFASSIYQRGLSISRWFPYRYKFYMLPLLYNYIYYKLLSRIKCSHIFF